MTISEALRARIPRVRKPQWSNPNAYLRLPLFKGGHGPWAELYDDDTQQHVLNQRPGSQRILTVGDEDDGYEPYTGVVSPFEQHKDNFARVYEEA